MVIAMVQFLYFDDVKKKQENKRYWDMKGLKNMVLTDIETAKQLIQQGKKINVLQYTWEEILQYYNGDKEEYIQQYGAEGIRIRVRRLLLNDSIKDYVKKFKVIKDKRVVQLYLNYGW